MKNLLYAITLLSLLLSSSSSYAQLPLHVNLGSELTCDYFEYGINDTGNIPAGSGAIVSGSDIKLFAPYDHLDGGVNSCMYGSHLFAGGSTDLSMNYCDLAPFQEVSITLYFAEIYLGIQMAGLRQFDIEIQGTTVAAAFDVYAEADALNGGLGGNNIAVSKVFNATADAAGCLTVNLKDIGKDNPMISGVSLEDGHTSLPVEFLSFFAESVPHEGVSLKWETASELNNMGFEIEYSQNGYSFESAGFVQGVGTTTERQAYEYSFKQLPLGKYVFRLKQIDIDGSFSYSHQVELSLLAQDFIYISPVFPNPASHNASFNISVRETQSLQAEIMDIRGRRIANVFEGELSGADVRTIDLPISRLQPGVYLLHITGTGVSQSRKFIVK